MPILTQEPHQTHLQSLLSNSISERPPNPNGSRPAPLGDNLTWRGRKRSRSPSTSPVASARILRPWSGVTMAGDGEGLINGGRSAGNRAMEEQRQKAFGSGGESFEVASSFASGVGLVVPLDQPSSGGSSRWQTGIRVQERGAEASSSATISSETGISISELDHVSSASSRPHRSRVSSMRNSWSDSLDVRGIKYPQPQPSDHLRATNVPSRTRDVVPLWDVNASIDNQRMESPGSRIPRATETPPSEPIRKDVDDVESGEAVNSHYVLTNAVLRDLHAQRRTRRSFATPEDVSRSNAGHARKELGKTTRSPSPRSVTVALPASPSASITSASTSHSEDRDAERALLVARHEGIGMRYNVDGSSRARTGHGNTSPVRRGRVLSYDSDESDGERKVGQDAGIGAAKGTATRQMSGSLVSGYEDMNRLLGRLAIQRRGCRRA